MMGDLFGNDPKFKKGDVIVACNDCRSICTARIAVEGDEATVERAQGAQLLALLPGDPRAFWFEDHDWMEKV